MDSEAGSMDLKDCCEPGNIDSEPGNIDSKPGNTDSKLGKIDLDHCQYFEKIRKFA